MSDSQTHFVHAVRERVGEVVVGQDVVVERMLIALLTGGHLLLLGVVRRQLKLVADDN